MNRAFPIVLIVAALALQAFDRGWIPTPALTPPVATEHDLVTAFRVSLSHDLGAVAIGIDQGKTLQEVDAAIEAAFERAAHAADLELSDDIEQLADDDQVGLAALLRRTSEDLE